MGEKLETKKFIFLESINRAFGESFENLDQYKHGSVELIL